MTSQTSDIVKQIKRSFRLYMNGTASQSMREKGLNYKINWGIPLSQLRQMAAEYGKDCALATALWQDNVRECKILATLIMPPESMTESLAQEWVARAGSVEALEMLAFHVLQHIDGAEPMACRWLQSGDTARRLCAFHILSRLLQRSASLADATQQALLAAAPLALQGSDATLRHAAYNCLSRFADVDENHANMAKKALQQLNLDIFA